MRVREVTYVFDEENPDAYRAFLRALIHARLRDARDVCALVERYGGVPVVEARPVEPYPKPQPAPAHAIDPLAPSPRPSRRGRWRQVLVWAGWAVVWFAVGWELAWTLLRQAVDGA